MSPATPQSWENVDPEVPGLGTASGLCFDKSTTQYYGIPYGKVPGRFRRPQPADEPWPDKKWDGTKFQYVPFTSSSNAIKV